MKNSERRALKDAQPGRPRIRLVLGYRAAYETYLRNFLYTPATAPRLERPGQLTGITPSRVLVILLSSWQKEAMRSPGLFSAVLDWRGRWRRMGIEEIGDPELEGGVKVRQEKLLHAYDRMLEGCGTNSIANEACLDDQDAALLLAATERRKSAEKAGDKKS